MSSTEILIDFEKSIYLRLLGSILLINCRNQDNPEQYVLQNHKTMYRTNAYLCGDFKGGSDGTRVACTRTHLSIVTYLEL